MNPQTSPMSTPIQDRSITIFHNGKPITWRPRDHIPPSTTSTPASIPEAQPEEGETRTKIKLKPKLKKGLKKLFPQMTKQKHATKVFNTGVDTFSNSKHSFVNRLKFWKSGYSKSRESHCEECRSRKARLDPEDESSANPLQIPSIDYEKETYERAERMTELSETSIPRTTPIPIPGTRKPLRRRCSGRGKENQQDGNVRLDVKDSAFLNTISMSDSSIVNITIEDSPVLSSRPFATTEESLPEDGQLPSPEQGCFPLDEEDVGDLDFSPLRLHCTGPSPDILSVPNEMNVLVGPGIICPPGVDLEAELKEAMETSLPLPEVETESDPSPATPAVETTKHEEEGSEISLTESFSRTRSSLSSNDGHSAPSHSFHFEKPYSHLGSDFVDVEDYLINPSASFPQPKYPALDSSATTEDFGFRPTCECMPGSWPSPIEISSRAFLKDDVTSPRRGEDMSPNAIRLPTPDIADPRCFIMSQEEVEKALAQDLRPAPDTSLSFWKCRPIPGTIRDSSLSPSLSPSTTSLHLRGGGDESRFSLFRSVGRGKLVGNVERGKALLDEPVSGSYMIGCWGRNETWREFGVKMEKRVEKKKKIEMLEAEIEKLKAEMESEGGVGVVKEVMTNVKGWFVSGKGEEQATEEVVVAIAAE